VRRNLEEAEELTVAGLFRAAAEVLEEGGLDHPFFLYQRARLLYRAREYSAAHRLLQRPAFWSLRVRAEPSPEEFRRILYPLDRRTLKVGEEARGTCPADPLLVSAVILAESAYDPEALSFACARGLMQLMPETGQRVARRLGLPLPSPDDLFRPDLNVRLGCDFLSSLLAHFEGREVPAVAAYNAGLDVVREWWRKFGRLDEPAFIESLPYRETRQYVQRVLAYYRHYQREYRGAPREGRRGGGP
jgi:soluble lytic murein transglycosylase